MARYQVPQFIEVEDKIFGPLTLKQFVYIAGGAGVCVVLAVLLPLWLALILGAPFAALGLGLAFYRINGRPLVVAIEHALRYVLGSKLYLWKQRTPTATPASAPAAPTALELVPTLSQSKLKDLAWSLNIKDRL